MKFVQLICLFARDIAADIAIRLNQPPKEKFPKKTHFVLISHKNQSFQYRKWYDSMNRQKNAVDADVALIIVIDRMFPCLRSLLLYCCFVCIYFIEIKNVPFSIFLWLFIYLPFIQAEAAMKIVLGCHSVRAIQNEFVSVVVLLSLSSFC